MIVVSDTSPINYLILTGYIDLLKTLYHRVIIPRSVFTELNSEAAPAKVQTFIKDLPGWIEVRQAKVLPPLPLDPGEREAIGLAEEFRADLLLLDESKARDIARGRGLAVTGTLGIFERAAEQGFVDLPEAIDRLKKTNFRLAVTLFEEALKRNRTKKG